MFLLGYALTAVAFVVPTAPERSTSKFDLARCSLGATDIVVTDRDGRVRECWRGELKPGDVVGLGLARLTPANALPWGCSRLRPERALSGFYHSLPDGWRDSRYCPVALPEPLVWPAVPQVADTELRLVLFLRKEGTTGAGATWGPAAAPTERLVFDAGSRGSRYAGGPSPLPPVCLRLSEGSIDFMTSVALAEAGRVVTWQAGQFVPVALALAHFKADALARPAPPANAFRWPDVPPSAGPAEDPTQRIMGGGLR